MPSVCNISSADVVGVAPILRRLFVPMEFLEVIGPGMAKTSRFWSRAQRAVMRVPEDSVASTTRRPFARPEMMRLRYGKKCFRDAVL